MHRIDTDGHVNNTFSDGDPSQGVLGTKVDDDFLNAVQEELCAVVETCGGTLVKGSNGQVVAQMVSAATANKVVRRDASGRAQVADPSVAADIATKGYVDGVTFAPPSWTSASFNSTDYNGHIEYLKDRLGFVHVKGAVQAKTTSSAALLTVNLPAGYRPATNGLRFPTAMNPVGSNTAIINDLGAISIVASISNPTWLYLDGIHYLAEN